MPFGWVKTLVGAVLAINFAFPLVTVARDRRLWDEPMAVLASLMSLDCTIFGLIHMLTGLYELASLESLGLCRALQYGGSGAAISFKAAQASAAFDQFVAVMYPLHHYSILSRAMPWLLAAVWGTFGFNLLFGFAAHMTDMETYSEFATRRGGNSSYSGCRWETAMANVFTIIIELVVAVFSFITAGMLLYTGIVGYRNAKRLKLERRRRRGVPEGEDGTFFVNYRAFKRIVTVLSLTVTLDIVAPLIRISGRWYPQPTLNLLLNQARLFGFIFEGWAYGLLNAKLRAAYRAMVCGGSASVDGLGTASTAPARVAEEAPVPEPPEAVSQALEPPEAVSQALEPTEAVSQAPELLSVASDEVERF